MVYLWATLLVMTNTMWLALVVFGLPGNWLMVITTAAVAWWQWDRGMFSPWTLLGILAIAIAGEVGELLTGVLGVGRAGGSLRGALGALGGGLVGAIAGTVIIPVPLVGTLLGACAGAAVGAWWMELAGGKPMRPAIRSGIGAGIGRFVGTAIKLAAGIAIWIVAAVAAFWR